MPPPVLSRTTAARGRVVFLGPSLDPKEAENHLEARYLPPIRRGDLPKVIAEGAQEIGIIDGEFGQSLAVSVMEICAGLKQGVVIRGAASMGALRAAECQSAGMLGTGWIFEGYVKGLLRADDEVALMFDPRTYQALTIPLVNVRWALRIAIEANVLAPSVERDLLQLARRVRYTTRDQAALRNAGSSSPLNTEMCTLVEFMETNPLLCDRKRLDALLLLKFMQGNTSRLESIT